MKSKISIFFSLFFFVLVVPTTLFANPVVPESKIKTVEPVKLENPISVPYLEKHLLKSAPRLILSQLIEKELKNKLSSDSLVKSFYETLKLETAEILTEPYLIRKITGRRMLSTSREMVYRMGVLCMVYRIEKNPEILKRIDEELKAVCQFVDWNPKHFLDVGEMSLAVALAIDWTGDALPKKTVELAKRALIEKGILPSYDAEGYNWWIRGTNNWSQVCHGGMIAASIVIAEENPELAAKTISRALDNLHHAMKEYGPDGIYPEGATYWGYGTVYSVLTSSMLSSAFGTDFGIADYPAFLESADFRLLVTAPSGYFFNFSDCGDKKGGGGSVLLAWFAAKTGNGLYFDKDFFEKEAKERQGKTGRFAGPGLVWLSQFNQKNRSDLPLVWKGDGNNPLVIYSNRKNDSNQYFFGAKGGRGSNNHGNMDAGTFVFDLNGIRWVVDPGNQGYHELEQAGFDLWDTCQVCQRWTLLTKNNFGHSTLTVDDALHNVSGFAPIIEFKTNPLPEATIDLSEIFQGHLKSAQRKFTKDTDFSILIEDQFILEETTKLITWAIMTTADVIPVKDGAILKQGRQKLKLEILSPGNVSVSTISLDPPPNKLDKRIEGLKRIEIRVPAYLFPEGSGAINVRLSGDYGKTTKNF